MFHAVFVCFSLYLVVGRGGGSPKVCMVHNLLFTVASSKIEVFETYFFDTVIT